MPTSQTGPKGRFRFAPTLKLQDSLSLAAFVMSLSITLINIYYAMRGAEIAVDPPAQLIIYRDGEGDASVLTAGVRIDMINVADGYGDVLKTASLSLDGGRTRFEYEGTIRTVFAGPDQKSPDCELGLRCLQLPGLYVIERTDEILDMPSGAARAFTLSFPVVSWNCAASGKDGCSRFDSFPKTIATLSSRGLSARIELGFHSDGDRKLTCTTGALDRNYLQKVGWISLPCEIAKA
jgi:hypothetical protein